MALTKDDLQAILSGILQRADRAERYDAIIDLVRNLSLDELDLCFGIINDPKNSISQQFDGIFAFNEPASLLVAPAIGQAPPTYFDTIPRTTAIRITMLSLRFDDWSEIAKAKKKTLYLYKIAADYERLAMSRLSVPNAPKESAFRKSVADRRNQITLITEVQVPQLVAKIGGYVLKSVSELLVEEMLLITTPDENSILGELLLSLLSFGFDKVLEGMVGILSGAVKERLLDALTSPDGVLKRFFSKNLEGSLFDGRMVYDFLSKDDTFLESGMQKTLHVITSKEFADPEAAVKQVDANNKRKEIKKADELRNVLIDYTEMLQLNLLQIRGHLLMVFQNGAPVGSLPAMGFEQLTDDDLDALYLYVFGYDYEAVIQKFIDDYTRCVKDIGLFDKVTGDTTGWTQGYRDYRIATWLVWKSKAYLVLADVPFSRRLVLNVRVYDTIPKTVRAIALEKTRLTIAAYPDDFGGKMPILYPSSAPLIPLDNAPTLSLSELRSLYQDVSTRSLVEYPNQKSGAQPRQ